MAGRDCTHNDRQKKNEFTVKPKFSFSKNCRKNVPKKLEEKKKEGTSNSDEIDPQELNQRPGK